MPRISYRRRLRLPRKHYPRSYTPPSSDEEYNQPRNDKCVYKPPVPLANLRMLMNNNGGMYTSSESEEDEEQATDSALATISEMDTITDSTERQWKNWVVVESDGGVYTTDEDDSVLSKSPIFAPSPPRISKTLSTTCYRTQMNFRHLLAQSAMRTESSRLMLYNRMPLFNPIEVKHLTISRIAERVEWLLDVIADMVEFSFYCAEYFHKQILSLPVYCQSLFRKAVSRAVMTRIFSETTWLPLEERRRLQFIYSTFFSYLYLVQVIPAKLVKKCVNKLFQMNNFDEDRIPYFDPDLMVYVTRILKITGFKYEAENTGRRKTLNRWWRHLSRLQGGPQVVQALLDLRIRGQWEILGRHGRTDDFECQQSGDDVALNTRNSYGRKLFCSSEILSLYSSFFLGLFSSRRNERKLVQLELDVDYYLLKEILNVIYHKDRIFTDEDLSYEMDVLMDIYDVAQEYDFPLVKRMVSEQLDEEPAYKVVECTYNRGYIELLSDAVARLREDEAEHFLMNCDLHGDMKMQDMVVIMQKLFPQAFEINMWDSPPEREFDVIFPSDFSSRWSLCDLTIQCIEQSTKLLYANSTVLATFSNSFRKRMESIKERPRPFVVEVHVKFNVMKAILRIIHHVNRRFGRLPPPNVSPYMVGPLLAASVKLEMPLITKMMEDVMASYSRERLILAAISADVPAADCERQENGAIAQLIYRSVAKK